MPLKCMSNSWRTHSCVQRSHSCERVRKIFRTLILLTLTTATVAADTQYMIDYVLPRGGARGSTVTAEFHGRSLENPKEILFYGPGITAATFTPFAKPTDGFKVKFQIAANCPVCGDLELYFEAVG